jgi:predicted ATPase
MEPMYYHRTMDLTPPYLVRLQLKDAPDGSDYPFSLPLIRSLDIEFTASVTYFVGENGTGKSTVIEAIAALCKLPVSGGSRNELAGNHGPDSSSPLARFVRPSFRRRPPDAYFLRSEFQAHFASLLDARSADPDFRMQGDPYARYGGRSLHTRSHGEAFLAILQNRIRSGFLLFDEPESALSPQRQLALLAHMSALVADGKSQFIIATHSPILLTFPGAQILSFDGDRLHPTSLDNTSHFQITKGILQNPAVYWKHLQASRVSQEEPIDTQPRMAASPRARRSKALGVDR